MEDPQTLGDNMTRILAWKLKRRPNTVNGRADDYVTNHFRTEPNKRSTSTASTHVPVTMIQLLIKKNVTDMKRMAATERETRITSEIISSSRGVVSAPGDGLVWVLLADSGAWVSSTIAT